MGRCFVTHDESVEKVSRPRLVADAISNVLKEKDEKIKSLEGLLSQDTSEFKSAAFQKIKSLEEKLKKDPLKRTFCGKPIKYWFDLEEENKALRETLKDCAKVEKTFSEMIITRDECITRLQEEISALRLQHEAEIEVNHAKHQEIVALRKELDNWKHTGKEDMKHIVNAADEIASLRHSLEVAREAIESMLSAHVNLYKSCFGEKSNPEDDCVYREAKQALAFLSTLSQDKKEERK
jgi:predicted  nucleic acid-binding Zn-ribbon protein